MTTRPTRRARRLLGAALLLVGPAAAAGAQGGTDPRWNAFLGCWTPVDASGAVATGAPLVCVVPASGGAVEVLTIADGAVAARDRLEATADRRPRSADGCEGWEQAQWSGDGRRVHLRSAATCASGVTRSASGILAFTPDGDWLDVRSASVGTGAGVRVNRYRATATTAIPAEVRSALATVRRDEDARLALGAPVAPEQVAEAVRLSDAPVVEGWLAARGQGFALDGRTLTALADRGVPERVIDVMVALSYPKQFAVNPSTGDSERRTAAANADVSPRPGPVAVLMDPYFGAPGWGGWRYGAYGSRYGAYGLNGLYNPYFGGFFGSGFYPGGSPVVIVPRGDSNDGRVRAVPGRGYSRGGSSSGGAPGATPRADRSSGSSGSSSGRASSGGSSSGSSSSGSSGGRTAKPRGGS
ncbi:hypothetical protein [Roseisolibacter sp. H3M3-2]|uniref:hypothetical protein n=1 Tax=Roseisolibacter sp. H3M3-2 TaxID=3031323 RepID=UPI0023DB9DB4|nr:hypothetical protein [Roseisolibacter sp. H3M3-2]MDF1503325.1 hypothetical protein [Roseisolibacter sp. H3M3-2]